MTVLRSNLQRVFIAIQPNHLTSLKYFDKLYDYLIEDNIEIVYLFKNNSKMKNYCIDNKKKFEIIDLENNSKSLMFILEPIFRYKLKKLAEEITKKYDFKVVIQYNDTLVINDLIVKAAKKFNISTIVLQWAVTSPEELDLRNRQLNKSEEYKKKSLFRKLSYKFSEKILKIIHYPYYHLFGVYSNHKFSMGQGDSDLIGVINRYTKNLFIKQGISEKKIRILGLLHYDDVLRVKNKSINEIRNKYEIDESELVILFISQPFYRKDIAIFTFNEQLNYVRKLIKTTENFYHSRDKKYRFLIKLHPFEDLSDYKQLINIKNVKIFTDVDNNELIILSNVCISQHSTVLQSVIVMGKPLISLNVLNLKAIDIGAKILGINKCVTSWNEYKNTLEMLEKNSYSPLNNISYNHVILDGKCYERTISFIKNLIRITELNKIRNI